MSAKSILQKIKQVIGLSGAGNGDAEPAESGRTEVTIEREPDRDSPETEASDSTGEATASGTAGAGTTDAAAEQASTDTADATEGSGPGSEPTNAIKGIGPTYSERLGEAGIETVSDLADADPETVADAAKAGESKAMSWVERANGRLS